DTVGIGEGTVKTGECAVKADEDAFSGGTVKNEDLVKAAENLVHKLTKRAVGQMVVVIVDALDELDKAKELTSILWELAPELPANVKVILTSRPEDDMILGRPDFIETISLKTEDTIGEVGGYICAELENLAMKQSPKWEHWPPSPLTKMLSIRANGLFLYGATVVTWITGRVTRRPYERNEIINMVQDFVPGDLNSLYNNILVMWAKDPDGWDKPENDYQYGKIKGTSADNATHKVRLDPDQLVQFRCIMQCLLTLELPLDIAAIGTLCELKGAPFIVQQLRSLLVRGLDDIKPDMIPGMHRSFREYITSTQTAEAFRINIAEAHLATAKACMQLVVKVDHEESKAINYAMGFWPRHLHLSNCSYPDDKVKKLIDAMADRDPGAYTAMNVICTICEIGWTWLKVS
ncbi:MAG TPA: hypothetical protein VGO47_08645, partial [Chlamydiales bacterium]|nr:hypothetical protein [Chlamydiales bacterium]